MVGDFDSSQQALKSKYADIPREIFPPDKDMTDSALACERALQKGLKSLFCVVLLEVKEAIIAFLI